jgi:hypothetical protein
VIEFLLRRRWFTDRATEGALLAVGVAFVWTLEDVSRGLRAEMPLAELVARKVPGATAIPTGRYRIALTPSERARRGALWSPRADFVLPLILDVPGYQAVRIHAGNRSGDTEGCVLVGLDRSRPDDDCIGQSRAALIAVMAKIEAAEREGVVGLVIEEKPEVDERIEAIV